MLSCPQHKGRNYLQAEGTNLYGKETPREFDFKYFSNKVSKF